MLESSLRSLCQLEMRCEEGPECGKVRCLNGAGCLRDPASRPPCCLRLGLPKGGWEWLSPLGAGTPAPCQQWPKQCGLRSPVLWDQHVAQSGVWEGFSSPRLRTQVSGFGCFCSVQGDSISKNFDSASAAELWIWSKNPDQKL